MSDAPMMLVPIFETCPTKWVSPCSEACDRDITTCCYKSEPIEVSPYYYKPEPPPRWGQGSHKTPLKCTVKDCTADQPDQFYEGMRSRCKFHVQERQRLWREKKGKQTPGVDKRKKRSPFRREKDSVELPTGKDDIS